MKLSNFKFGKEVKTSSLEEVYNAINDQRTGYPSDKTIHHLFSEQTAKTPESVAVSDETGSITYQELEKKSNQLAHFLMSRNPKKEFIAGILQDRSIRLAISQLGILKAGGAYLPLTPSTPFNRMRFILEDAEAEMLLFDSEHLRNANKLQWECETVRDIICIDSDDFNQLNEGSGEMMEEDTWELIRREMDDDISGGGWKSSFTGELLSREVMDEYAENIEKKLTPHADRNKKVLEIGVASGMSMFRLAPKVEHYVGTELTGDILEWTQNEADQKEVKNISLKHLAAHETDQLEENNFDIVIINSVIQCFSGHNYLKQTLEKSIQKMNDEGLIFLGNIWDLKRKDQFIDALENFQNENAGKGYTTKTDRYEELFLSEEWFTDLQKEWPWITDIQFSPLIAAHQSELSDYSYDILLKIDKRRMSETRTENVETKQKYQFDLNHISSFDDSLPDEKSSPASLANLMYTSGSTGRPKGVMVEHKNVIRLVRDTNYISIQPDDVVFQGGIPSFDASTIETFLALLNGAQLYYPKQEELLIPQQLSDLLNQNKITVMFITTRLFNLLTDQNPEAFQTIRVLMSGGERASAIHFNKVRNLYPDLKLMNVYGPTENTGYSTYHLVEKEYDNEIPIGVPVANSTVYVVDEALNLVPVGKSGELLVGGDGVARGYVKDHKKTEALFITNPFSENDRLYKTGDIVRLNADHQLEYIERKDKQVKIRGNRVEPGEIEHQILSFSTIKEAVVIPVNQNGEQQLACYMVCNGETDFDVLRDQLKRKLPEVMIPAHFQVVESLPINANGKLEVSKLPDISTEINLESAEQPSTETEYKMVQIWKDLLSLKSIGVNQNFFDLGGHSLTTAKLVSAIEKEMDVTLPFTLIFTANTVRDLSAYIDNLDKFDSRIVHNEMVQLSKPEPETKSIFAFPPGSGYSLAYSSLAPKLKPFGFYGFTFIDKVHRLDRYVQMITKTEKPPYILFGYSGGGKLAYLVAQELERQGFRVDKLVMVDSARYVTELPVSDADIQYYASEFLEGVTSKILRETVISKMKSYRQFLAGCIEKGTIDADITVIQGSDSEDLYHGPDGKEWATMIGWDENTRGNFELIKGSGSHKVMLNGEDLVKNSEIILQALKQS